jgi:hypothetical protein
MDTMLKFLQHLEQLTEMHYDGVDRLPGKRAYPPEASRRCLT